MEETRASRDLPVAIVGAGFSGSLLAINLLRNGVRVVLVEKNEPQLAKGLAFGTRRPEHLLNVRAANMSAFPDDAGHFLRWMGFSSTEQANRFVPRLSYGMYLRELLVDALAAAGGLADVRAAGAEQIHFDDGAVMLALADGSRIACRAVVLALGNAPPMPHPLLAPLPPVLHFADPWRVGVHDGLGDAGHVFLLGTGLTAIDVVMSLTSGGFPGRITALSRRGLRPRSHAETGPVAPSVARPGANGAWLVHAIRQRAREVDWRQAVDELRPHTQQLWRRLDLAGQRRFLRHLRPYWDVHRHRLAPMVADRIAALEAEGRLRFVAGKLVEARAEGAHARITWRRRGGEATESVMADRVIACTGPAGDLRQATNPLLRDLLARGMVRADAHGLGLDVDHLGRVRSAEGGAHDRLYAVGPLTKGEAWETIAVPDIRRQVWDLARLLANAHWVGGEGL